jgi:hypothetical protein
MRDSRYWVPRRTTTEGSVVEIRVSTVRFRPWPLLGPIEVQQLTKANGHPFRVPVRQIFPKSSPNGVAVVAIHAGVLERLRNARPLTPR